MRTNSFIEICHEIPDEDLKNIINFSFEHNKKELLSYYKTNLSKFFPGFRSIDKVPAGMQLRRIKTDCKENHLMARAIIKVWFENHEELKNKIKNTLTELKYEVKEPDFENIGVELDLLKEEHFFSIEGNSYFGIDGKAPEGCDLFDSTLMTVLLGFFPGKLDEEEAAAAN
jgi:hypothetical protein